MFPASIHIVTHLPLLLHSKRNRDSSRFPIYYHSIVQLTITTITARKKWSSYRRLHSVLLTYRGLHSILLTNRRVHHSVLLILAYRRITSGLESSPRHIHDLRISARLKSSRVVPPLIRPLMSGTASTKPTLSPTAPRRPLMLPTAPTRPRGDGCMIRQTSVLEINIL